MRNSVTDFPPSEREGDSIIEAKIQIEQDDDVAKKNKKKMRRDLFSAELSISDVSYFDEPFREIFDNSTDFNLSIFIEISIYHVLFFAVLGPLVSFLIFLRYRKMTLARNLGFWGNNRNLYVQSTLFLVVFISVFGFLYFKVSIITPIEIFMLFGGCVIRSFVIAIKYALFPTKKMDYVKNKLLTIEDVTSEYLLGWLNQTEEAVGQELMNTIIRNNIDEDLFLFFFLRPLKPDLLEGVTKMSSWEEKFRKNNKRITSQQIVGIDDAIYGFSIARYLIREDAKKKNVGKTLYYLSLILSGIHAVIPIIYRVIINSTVFGINTVEKTIGVCLFVGNIVFYFFNFLFILIGVFEYDRLTKLLSQLSNLLATKKVEKYHTKKIFPTINIFCSMTFRSWYTLNLMARDYGKKYQKRVDMYMAVFVLYYLIVGFACILSIFNMLPRFPLIYFVLMGFEMLVFFTIVFIVLFKGVIINDHFVLHQTLLNDLRTITNDFITMDNIYFNNKYFVPKNEVYLLGKEHINVYLEHFFGTGETRPARELRERYFKNLLSINKFISSQLAFEFHNKPFKVLGIPATAATIQSFLAGIGTAATIAFNKLSSD